MKRLLLFLPFFALLLVSGCASWFSGHKSSHTLNFTVLQLNDVYEIASLENGRVGGMARVATLKKQLLAENPNTIAIIAGDFLSPSVMGTLQIDGKKVKGSQMIEVLNASGIDFVTFGNHEFDLKEEELLARIEESTFGWMSSNILHKKGENLVPFDRNKQDFPTQHIWEVKNAKGEKVSVGFFAVTLPFNKAKYVDYKDFLQESQNQYTSLSATCPVVLGITHLNLEDDKKVAQAVPKTALIMGGHDHNNMRVMEGNVPITKADANAKTAYIHRFSYDTKTGKLSLNSELKTIDASIPEDAAVAAIVKKWEDKAAGAFAAQGFDPEKKVCTLTEPFDGLEAHIRMFPTALTRSLTAAMYESAPALDAAVLNSGSVRVDDILTGTLTEYDVIRTLPFGGSVLILKMKGSLLSKTLDVGEKNLGAGGFLQYHGVEKKGTEWFFTNGKKVSEQAECTVAITEFLMTGGEKNLEFLTRSNPDILKVEEPQGDLKDIRLIWMKYLRK